MKSIRQIGNCIGLQNKISIIKNFFGYSERWKANLRVDNNFFWTINSLSVLDQMKHYMIDHNVHLHIRTGVAPNISIDRMIYAMRSVYNKYGLGVVIRSNKTFDLSNDFRPLDVAVTVPIPIPVAGVAIFIVEDLCANSLGTSDDQDDLFSQHKSGVDPSHILVFFIDTTDPPSNGCSSHPSDTPGAVIAKGATLWTLAHEVGHVLGLSHTEGILGDVLTEIDINALCEFDHLMTTCGTGKLSTNSPILDSSEVQKMKDSNLTIRC